MQVENILVLDKKMQRELMIWKEKSYYLQLVSIEVLNNRLLLTDHLLTQKYDLLVIPLSDYKSKYLLKTLLTIEMPMLIIVNEKEKNLVSLVKNAKGIIKKGQPQEFFKAIKVIEQGGYFISKELNKYIHFWKNNSTFSEYFCTIVSSLTEMELRVAEEIVYDKTNQEIADTLFLSKRTVEYYVTSCIQKLGVNSRVGLAVKMTQAKLINDLLTH